MKSNFAANARADIEDVLAELGYELVVDEWIFREVPCVLLYKDGCMDIYPVQEYTCYEFTMLQNDLHYKSAWISIGYGCFLEMQERMYEILREGLVEIGAKPQEVK